MKSFTTFLFTAVAFFAVTSAVPVESDTIVESDTRNQDCKKPIQAAFNVCQPNGKSATECQEIYDKANKKCDDKYPTSRS
ncbi:hypothetical protein BGZ96_004514 [Linnemannia gamsii]|uniref:Uncharacterized protein n=1 Tax=Linnemannia gamsii TaxID=64522 RepID=A0ABQ7KGN8_9FUNG|nr:hypothetical protein BGZ96_004514 [Linnemannia gamsii]